MKTKMCELREIERFECVKYRGYRDIELLKWFMKDKLNGHNELKFIEGHPAIITIKRNIVNTQTVWDDDYVVENNGSFKVYSPEEFKEIYKLTRNRKRKGE